MNEMKMTRITINNNTIPLLKDTIPPIHMTFPCNTLYNIPFPYKKYRLDTGLKAIDPKTFHQG